MDQPNEAQDRRIRLASRRPMVTDMDTDPEYARAVRAAAKMAPKMTVDDVAFLAKLTGRDLRPALPADGDAVGVESLRSTG